MTATDHTTAIVSKLEHGGFDLRPTGTDSWDSRCPAHDGSRRNLSIKRGEDGRVLLYCHRQPGCDPAAISAALGMKLANLFPADPTRAHVQRNGNGAMPKSDHRGPRPGNGRVGKSKPPRSAYPSPETALAKVIKQYGTPLPRPGYTPANRELHRPIPCVML